jgi:hypothetical protein
MSDADITAAIKKNLLNYKAPTNDSGFAQGLLHGATLPIKSLVNLGADLGGGIVDKAVGLFNPDLVAMNAKTAPPDARAVLNAKLDQIHQEQSQKPAYGAGDLFGQIGSTWGVGSALAKPLENLAPMLSNAIGSGGMSLGTNAVKDLPLAQNIVRGGTRLAGGAINAGVTGGLLGNDPIKSAALGAAIPAFTGTLGKVGGAIGNAVVGKISPEVQALYNKAQDLGVNVPLDRLANSKPLNAIASSLNYIPLSGRTGLESDMENQLNTALSKTFGQNSPNVTMALRNAKNDLGGKFDDVLKSNGVNFDKTFLNDVTNTQNDAANVLVGDQLSKINKQIDNIIGKTDNGVIDGQAAYNIKKQLDTLSNSNDSEVAKYARDLRDNLMGALNRSLGPQQAADFATTRQQWGNMRSLEKLASNGADGGISVAKLANMKNIGNKDLQDLADVAAQFVKQRESQHGAAQRVFGTAGLLGAGGILGGLGGAIPAVATGMALGRTANSLLNSNTLKQRVMGNAQPGLLDNLMPYLAKSSPALLSR